MGNYRFILIDFDDTLLDFEKTEVYAFHTCMKRNEIACDEKAFQRYREINQKLWLMLSEGKVTKEKILVQRFEMFLEELGSEKNPAKVNESYLKALGEPVYYIDGATKVLKELSKVCEIYVITNGVLSVQTPRLERADFKEYVKGCFVSEEIGYEKPQKEYFESVFQQIPGFVKEQALVVGDSLVSDIRGGNNAGVSTCWYNPKKSVNQTSILADYEIHTLEELIKLV